MDCTRLTFGHDPTWANLLYLSYRGDVYLVEFSLHTRQTPDRTTKEYTVDQIYCFSIFKGSHAPVF